MIRFPRAERLPLGAVHNRPVGFDKNIATMHSRRSEA